MEYILLTQIIALIVLIQLYKASLAEGQKAQEKQTFKIQNQCNKVN